MKNNNEHDILYMIAKEREAQSNSWYAMNKRINEMNGQITDLSNKLEKIIFALQVTDLLKREIVP